MRWHSFDAASRSRSFLYRLVEGKLLLLLKQKVHVYRLGCRTDTLKTCRLAKQSAKVFPQPPRSPSTCGLCCNHSASPSLYMGFPYSLPINQNQSMNLWHGRSASNYRGMLLFAELRLNSPFSPLAGFYHVSRNLDGKRPTPLPSHVHLAMVPSRVYFGYQRPSSSWWTKVFRLVS